MYSISVKAILAINYTYMSKKNKCFRIRHAFVLNTFIYPKGYELLLIGS